MKLIIGADLVPAKTNENLFVGSDVDALLGEDLKDLLSKADYRVFNLETPLFDENAPIDKCGPCLRAPTATVNAVKAMNVSAFTLANNHIMDHGEEGLKSTCGTLADNGIRYFGVGKNEEEAAKPLILEKDGKRIGIFGCVEHEFSLVSSDSAGANPFDPLETPDMISELKNGCDFVIVLYHGGKEFYRYPSPELQKICRKLADKGADLVITQHCHCIGCREKYKNKTIVYGQGNFLFDDGEDEYLNTGLLISVDDGFGVDYIPVCKSGSGVRLAKGAEKDAVLDGFFKRSEEITRDGFVEKSYNDFADRSLERYLLSFDARKKTFFFKVMNRLTGRRWQSFLLNRKYKKNDLLKIQNYVECEAHRELMLRGIKNKYAK